MRQKGKGKMSEEKRGRLNRITNIPFLRERAYQAIKEAIISLKLEPGEKLKESTLVEELGISKTPIREALTRLQHEGLVEVLPFRGAFVAEIDDRDMEEIFELRELLEGAAVKRAAISFSLEDSQEGEALLEEMRTAYKAGDIKAYARPSRDFHNLFIGKLGNQRMISVLKTFDDQLERIRVTAIRTLGNIPLFIEDYEKILKALKAGDPEAAEKALLFHLKKVKEIFLKRKRRKAG